MNTLAWRTPTTPLPTENNPRVVFERLFGEGGTAAQRLAQMREDRSILDSVTEQMRRLQRGSGRRSHAASSDYLDGGPRNRAAHPAREKQTAASAELPTLERPIGIPDRFDEHAKLMFDLQCLAFQADITRVFTFMLGREDQLAQLPGDRRARAAPRPCRTTATTGEDGQRYAKINTYHAQLFAYFLEKLQSTPDGDGTLLDHSMLLYGAGLSDANQHSHSTCRSCVVGGDGSARRAAVTCSTRSDTPMTNLLVSMLDKVGVPVEHIRRQHRPDRTRIASSGWTRTAEDAENGLRGARERSDDAL